MTVRHVVRCDECEVEGDLIQSVSAKSLTSEGPAAARSYAVPSNWEHFDGWHFCSYACVARYAEAQAKRAEER